MNRLSLTNTLALPLALVFAAAPSRPQGAQPSVSVAAPPHWQHAGKTYRRPEVARVDFESSPRLKELLRAGNLYLTLRDAIALAIENNLDIELQRFNLDLARADVLRSRGGGTLRGVPYTVSETPVGVGGPFSPLLTNTTIRTLTGTSVATNPAELGILGQAQSNLSILGTIPQSNGPSLPAFDPALVGQWNWAHQTTPQTNSQLTGTPSLVVNNTLANAGFQQGLSYGTQVSAAFNNTRQSLNSLRSGYSPFTSSSFGVTFIQPLARGFGRAVNRRFIRIAENQAKISGLILRQQLVATVYGVTRLYADFLALYQDLKVKEDALAVARKLLEDTKAQVEEGTVAPMELTRANAQVSSNNQDVINARGLLEEQEAILKNVLVRRGLEEDAVRSARILPLDTLEAPGPEQPRPFPDLVAQALASRPDYAQAELQIANVEIGLEGVRNGLLPQVDLVATAQNVGLAGQANPLAPTLADPRFVGGYASALEQIATRKYPTYAVGLQVSLPLRNRVAQADAARDEVQLRQAEIRRRQLQNQVRLEIENALIALRRARAAYEAASRTRELQEQALQNEQARYEVGASTTFFVIQYENYVAQARSTELAARSAYMKAHAALQRATGTILADNGVVVD